MAFWNRRKTVVSPEFEEYYMAERRERAGLAWLLALVSFAVSLALLILLFLGGRWAYRRLMHQTKPTNGVVATSDSNGVTNQSNVSTPAPTPPSAVTPVPTSNTPAPAPTPPTTVTRPITTTGPTNVAALFIGTAAMSTLLYERRLLKKSDQ